MTLILYGRDLSPFKRRVAIWLRLQGRDYESRPLMVNGPDWETLKEVNPMGRVPVLIADDGAALIETSAIIDWLEDTAPEDRRLLPPTGLPRRDVLQAIAFANATVEKAVALVYDKNRRPEEFHWPEWQKRLESQVEAGLGALESRCPESGWLGGDRPNGADVALVVAHDFLQASNPYLLESGYPRLSALAMMAAEVEAFADTHPAR